MFKSLYSFKVFTLFASIPQMQYAYETKKNYQHQNHSNIVFVNTHMYGIHDVQMYLKVVTNEKGEAVGDVLTIIC